MPGMQVRHAKYQVVKDNIVRNETRGTWELGEVREVECPRIEGRIEYLLDSMQVRSKNLESLILHPVATTIVYIHWAIQLLPSKIPKSQAAVSSKLPKICMR